jgi:hypothetical protein
MQNFLSYEEKKPLSYAMMKKHAPSWCSVRLYDGLSKYSSLKAAAGSKPCMIVLYELHERDETAVGHYSLVILGAKPRYFSSYGFEVDKEIALTHSKGTLKDLLGDHTNDKVPYQREEHTQTCWKWCLLRATVHKMPEARFKELFYSSSPKLKTPDDLCSVVTLGLLGPEYMAGSLYKAGPGKEVGRETAGGRLKKRGKRGRKVKRKRRVRRLPLHPLQGRTPWTRLTRAPRYDDPVFINTIPQQDRTPYEQDRLQLERNYMTKLYQGGLVNRLRKDWRV